VRKHGKLLQEVKSVEAADDKMTSTILQKGQVI